MQGERKDGKRAGEALARAGLRWVSPLRVLTSRTSLDRCSTMRGSLVAVQSFFWIGVICVPYESKPCEGEYNFPCSNGLCVKLAWVCDNDNDCGDDSDEKPCGPQCPKYSYECTRGPGCYHYSKRCDGWPDCPDASDETNCDGIVRCAMIGYEQCTIGGCAEARDLCCPIRNGSCVQQNINVSTPVKETRLIFADRDDLYTLSFANDRRQPLHRLLLRGGSDFPVDVTALAYSAKEHTVFWAAGPRIWSTSLIWEGKYKKSLGKLHFDCTIQIMVFDWITQNFYLVCERSTRVTVCRSHAANNSMLCSHLIAVDLWKITWLGLNPNAGLIFVGGPGKNNFEILEAEIDGSSQRRIYQGEGIVPECYLNMKKNEISLLHLDGNGNFSTLNLASGTVSQRGSEFLAFGTTARALASDLAILHDSKGSFALFLWDNGTVFTQKKVDMMAMSKVSLLIEPDAQPPGENSCKDFGCDHICLLASSGPFCKCDLAYELMDDKHSCELPAMRPESPKNEVFGIGSEIPPALFPKENTYNMETHEDFRIHIFYIAVFILGLSSGAAICFYLLSRKKLCSDRATTGITNTSVSFVAPGNTSKAQIGTFRSAEDDPFIKLET